MAILIDDGYPIIFKQKRVGYHKTEIIIHKFRSMKVSNDNTPKYANDEQHRITKVGNFIRRTRLDELPQLYDVLIGRMSIIGPRPEQIYFSNLIEQQTVEYGLRYNVKPGITGWAQINWKYTFTPEDTIHKLEFDLYYIANKNFLM
ncbi:MAG: sugar transferase [Candidatus Micrarchaeaceae archaeon]